jgi:integrase
MKGHIRERSPGHWAIVIDVYDPETGKRRQKWHSFKGTKREAQAKQAELLAALGKGEYIEPNKTTVTGFVQARVDQWEAAGDISARTAERYRQLVKFQIEPHIGTRMLQKLRPLDIEQWHTTLRNGGRADGQGGISARTIGHAHRVLGKALRDAARDGLINRNVASMQSAPKIAHKEMVIVQDVPGFLNKLADSRLRGPAMVALFTGMRLSEILALRWSRVDLDRKVIQVREALEPTGAHGLRFKVPKSKAGRRDVSLPDILVGALREHRKAALELRMQLGAGRLPDDALLFSNLDGEPSNPNVVSMAWGVFAASIRMPDITFHALRHTHASQLIDAGVDIVTISKRLGHAKPDITLRTYAHLFRKDDGKAADAINRAL